MLEGIVNPCTIKAIEAIEGCSMEEFIKKIVKHTNPVQKEQPIAKQDEWLERYPPVLQACHIMEITGFSNGKTYEIMRSKDCPTFKDGKRMVVMRDKFWEFLINRATKSADMEGHA